MRIRILLSRLYKLLNLLHLLLPIQEILHSLRLIQRHAIVDHFGLVELILWVKNKEYDFRGKGEVDDVLLVFLDLFHLDELVFALLPLHVAIVESLVVDAFVLRVDLGPNVGAEGALRSLFFLFGPARLILHQRASILNRFFLT